MVEDCLSQLCPLLQEAGIDRPRWEARQIAAKAASDREAQDMANRRAAGEPLAYVLGEWDFYGLTLVVNRRVLIPRPDTETLVDTALSHLRSKPENRRVLDLCCGSGCVGLAVASQHPSVDLTLADFSMAALAVAGHNARKMPHAALFLCNALANPPVAWTEAFDLVLANPPYIADDEWDTLPRAVTGYEPHIALRGGADGLDFYRAIAGKWRTVLRKGGLLAFEVGCRQADAVAAIMAGHPFDNIRILQDTAAHPRVVAGQIR